MLSVIREVFRYRKKGQHENVASKSCKFCLSTKNKYHYFMPILYMKYECYVIMLLDKTSDDYYLGLWNKVSS